MCVARAPRKKSIDDFEAPLVIHNPHALPLFRDQPSRKRQREKILKDPIKSHKPEIPINGPGYGGRVGASKGSLLTQYLLKVNFSAVFSFLVLSLDSLCYTSEVVGKVANILSFLAARWYDQGDMDERRS